MLKCDCCSIHNKFFIFDALTQHWKSKIASLDLPMTQLYFLFFRLIWPTKENTPVRKYNSLLLKIIFYITWRRQWKPTSMSKNLWGERDNICYKVMITLVNASNLMCRDQLCRKRLFGSLDSTDLSQTKNDTALP